MKIATGLVVAAIALAGCAKQPEQPKPLAIQLAIGTPVKLVLLKQLDSAKDAPGDPFALMVAEDVKDAQGNVLIHQGEVANGQIAKSRRAGALSSISNQPARLVITIDTTKSTDGQTVQLTAGASEDGLELTRDNTGKAAASATIEALWNDPNSRAAMESVPKMLADGTTDPAALAKVAQELNLPQTSKLLTEHDTGKLQDLLDTARKGGAVKALSGGSATLALSALIELAGVAGEVGNRVAGIAKGRNIKAYVGTPIEARVTAPITVSIPQPGPSARS